MRTKSLFGVKSITNLIYGLLMIAPFVAILSRVIYVQANPNAKDSYSDKTYSIEQKIDITNLNNLIENQFVYLELVEDTTNYQNNSYFIGYKNFDFGRNIPSEGYFQLGYNRGVSYGSYITIYDVNKNKIQAYTTSSVAGLYTFTFTNLSIQYDNNLYGQKMYVYQIITTEQKLDNAFEYSLSSFTQDNDIGVINFFGWFEGMFLNQSNAHNMVYLNFANWYMNYALLVSSSYLLFLALIWFVNYIRRILDKSMNHDFGGF